MTDTATPARRALSILADAAREFALGMAHAIAATAEVFIDALDDEPTTPSTPFTGLLAAMRHNDACGCDADDEPASDRNWVLTEASDLKPGDWVKFHYGAEYRVVEAKRAVVDGGGLAVTLHLADTDDNSRLVQVGVDTPLLACPETPDDLSALSDFREP
jgi:hypothetical protein